MHVRNNEDAKRDGRKKRDQPITAQRDDVTSVMRRVTTRSLNHD